MRTYAKVHTRIWNDKKFMSLSDDGRMVFLFLLTHPYQNGLGAFRATIAGLAEEIGWPEERFSKGFAQPWAKGMANHDSTGPMVWLPKHLKHNKPENPNVVKSLIDSYSHLPECPLLSMVWDSLETVCQTMAIPFGIPRPYGMPNPEPEPEPEPEPKTTTPAASKQPAATAATKVRKPNVWAWWVDANRTAGRKDPTPVGPDTAASKAISKLGFEEAEVKRLLAAYLGDADPFVVKQGHPLRLLPGRIDSYRNGTGYVAPESFDERKDRLAQEASEKANAAAIERCRQIPHVCKACRLPPPAGHEHDPAYGGTPETEASDA